MYRYDEFDHKIVTDRVNQFRGQVNRRISGELSEDASFRAYERRLSSIACLYA